MWWVGRPLAWLPRQQAASSNLVLRDGAHAHVEVGRSAVLRGGFVRTDAGCASRSSRKVAKARALALAYRPVGNTAHRSMAGKDQSSSTARTLPERSSGRTSISTRR
jgi:hypothetical protein